MIIINSRTQNEFVIEVIKNNTPEKIRVNKINSAFTSDRITEDIKRLSVVGLINYIEVEDQLVNHNDSIVRRRRKKDSSETVENSTNDKEEVPDNGLNI